MTPRLAMLSQELHGATREFRILPAGLFRAIDGRPQGILGWKINTAIASQLIARTAKGDDLSIDYDHQSIHTKVNGQPAPAAGWFKRMEWREGIGLFATDVRWTDKAKVMIAAREYRYISPVFHYGPDGDVLNLIGLGLTNTPALDGLTDLASIALNSMGAGNAGASPKPVFPASLAKSDPRGAEALYRMNPDAWSNAPEY